MFWGMAYTKPICYPKA